MKNPRHHDSYKNNAAFCVPILFICLLFPFILVFANALPASLAPSAANESAEITSLCKITTDDDLSNITKLTDVSQGTAWSSPQGFLEISCDRNIKHLYIEYYALPEKTYSIFCYSADGHIISSAPDTPDNAFYEGTSSLDDVIASPLPESDPSTGAESLSSDANEKPFVIGGNTKFISEVISLPEGTRKVRMEPENTGMGLTVLKIFGDGKIPSYVPQWEPTADKAALMVIVSHPDDDILWFGGTFPWYSGVQKLNTVVVYMTTPNRRRMSEALDCLWTAGVRQYPVFGSFPDKYMHPDELTEAWGGEERICEFITEQLRKYNPDVLMTHGPHGEYGHGAHKVTSSLVCKCADNVADPSFFPRLASEYGVWTPKKMYLHAYEKNPIKMNFDVKHDALGGLTCYEIADTAYKCHVSQQNGNHLLMRDGKTGCTEYGLYMSQVGMDINKNDIFENIEITDGMRRQPLTEDVPKVPFTHDDPIIKDEIVSNVSSKVSSSQISSLSSEEAVSEPPSSLPSDNITSHVSSPVSVKSEDSSSPEPVSSATVSSDAVSIPASHITTSASAGKPPSPSAIPVILIISALLLAVAGAAVIIGVNKKE